MSLKYTTGGEDATIRAAEDAVSNISTQVTELVSIIHRLDDELNDAQTKLSAAEAELEAASDKIAELEAAK